MAKQFKPKPCKRCKSEIPVERLQAVPGTQLCVRCSQAIGGEFDYSVTPENVHKAGSLKKNYASYRIKRKRRDISKELQ